MSQLWACMPQLKNLHLKLKKKKKDRPPCFNEELEQANKFKKEKNKSDLSKLWAYQMALAVKNPSANAGDVRDMGKVPGSGRSPGGEHSNPLQCSCLEHPMDRAVWRAMVHMVTKSWTQLKQRSMHACIQTLVRTVDKDRSWAPF